MFSWVSVLFVGRRWVVPGEAGWMIVFVAVVIVNSVQSRSRASIRSAFWRRLTGRLAPSLMITSPPSPLM